MGLVSVIINCLNGSRFLQDCIDSVYGQTYQNWEIILWDNASTDETPEIANQYDHKVRYFRSAYTMGLGMARSRAYQMATGDYIAILDSDDVWLPTKLEKQLNLFQNQPDLGLVYCDSYLFDQDGDKFRLFQTGRPKRGYVLGDLLEANFIFSSTMIFPRYALNELDHVFDEEFTRAQDYELTLRIANSFSVDYVDEPLSRWRMYQDNKEWQKWKDSLVPRVVEVRLAINKLITSCPTLESRHKKELKECNKVLDYNSGIVAWQHGDTNNARTYFVKNLLNKKSLIVFIFTFFMTYDVFQYLKSKYKNLILKLIKSTG